MATRLYFRAATAAAVSPAYDAAWDDVDETVRRALARTRLTTDTHAIGTTIDWTSGDLALDRQYVSEPLAAGVTFGSATVRAIIATRMMAADDAVSTRFGVRIVSEDGATERAVLLAVGDYSTAAPSALEEDGRICANDEALASYTTQDGDRIVIEFGYGDTAGVTPSARSRWGSSTATDQTFANDGETLQNPWVEFSNTLRWQSQTTDLATYRATTDQKVSSALIVFIEGIGYAWVTSHDRDVLLGNGSGTWIGGYEEDADYVAHETVGERTVVRGLQMPDSLPRGNLDPDTRMLKSTSFTLEIIDQDGIMPALFASEGKDSQLLGERVAPGTAALDATLIVQGGATIDPADMHIGIERIGPARERRWLYPFPWQGIGLHHPRHPSAQEDDGPPQVQVSSEPIEWAGRLVAVYRLYRDPNADPDSYASWPHWGEQWTGGGDGQRQLECWGVLQDRGEFQTGKWRLQCHGIESPLRKRMASTETPWMTVNSATLALAEEERGIAVRFDIFDSNDAGGTAEAYDSAGFDTIAGSVSVSMPATGTPEDILEAVSTAVQEVADGTIAADFGSLGTFLSGAIAGNAVSVSLDTIQVQGIGADADGTESTRMFLCLHEKVWRALGWEPQIQAIGNAGPETLLEVRGGAVAAGDNAAPADDASFVVPGSGYWTLKFTTNNLNDPEINDNDGAARIYEPKFPGGAAAILAKAGDQDIGVTASFPWLEGDLQALPDTYDRARYFVFRGKRTPVDGPLIVDANGDPVEAEPEDEAQVALVRWNESSGYGSVDDSAGTPTLHIVYWAEPRRFGVDRPLFQGEWSTLSGTEFGVECRPLSGYTHLEVASLLERSWAVLGQLLLSTGTATGWSGGTFTFGENEPDNNVTTDEWRWINDAASSELGLGIPHQLVQDPEQMMAAFDLGDLSDPHGGLNLGRYVYGESFESKELIESIVRPRGLSLTLRGGRYSVDRIGLFEPDDYDVIIDEAQVHGAPGDPRTVVPSQQLRATGSIDRTEIQVRIDPSTGDHVYEVRHNARDTGASRRRGDLVESLRDDGLIPETWKDQYGNLIADPWESAFRKLWAFEMPAWRAKRHFLVSLTLHRVGGQDVWPGSRVRFSNRWVFGLDGTTGVSGALGVVLKSVSKPRSEQYDVDVLVFADQFDGLRIFAPIAKIAAGYTGGATVTLDADADFLAHGEGDDGTRFTEPSWSSVGGSAVVCVLEYDRTTWTLHSADTQTVSSATGTSVTLGGAFSATLHAYTDKWLVMAPWSSQASDGWVVARCLPVLQSDLTHSSGESGFPFVDG